MNEERQKWPNSSQQYCMQIGKEHFSTWKNLIYHPNRRYKKKVLRLSNKFLLAEPEGGVDLISDLQEGKRKGPWGKLSGQFPSPAPPPPLNVSCKII